MLSAVRHEFVEHIPEQLADGVLYISVRFGTAVHRCACGCGEEVVTPLGPAEWQLTYDGRTVSLDPSIGNWGFACRSHYWIEKGQVRQAADFSTQEVELVRSEVRSRREAYYVDGRAEPVAGRPTKEDESGDFRLDSARRWRSTWTWLRSLGGRRRVK